MKHTGPLYLDGCTTCKGGLTPQTSFEAWYAKLAMRAPFCMTCFAELFFDILPRSNRMGMSIGRRDTIGTSIIRLQPHGHPRPHYRRTGRRR